MRNRLREETRHLASRAAGFGPRKRLRVAWVAADTLERSRPHFGDLVPPVTMRINNNAFWLSRHAPWTEHAMYSVGGRYDVVVFFKAMDERCQLEAERIKARGGKVVFDANVNYYEVWGEYEIDNTQPTETQQRDARSMTELADWVVADSEYLRDCVRPLNEHVTWIPDNVDLRVFRGAREHRATPTLRLIWSGVAQKAAQLTAALDALASVPGLELVLVTNAEPAVLPTLRGALPTRWLPFSERRYARALRHADVIVSPKRLVNAYEVAHTEYKISLGMAVGLPALASPQRSYVTAIEDRGGGILADSTRDWREALERLRDPAVRRERGAHAAETVREHYSTAVTGRAYLDVLTSVVE